MRVEHSRQQVVGTSCVPFEGILSQLPLAAGAVLVLLPFTFRGHQMLFAEVFQQLRDVSVERGYIHWCNRQGRKDKAWCLARRSMLIGGGAPIGSMGRGCAAQVWFAFLPYV